MKLITLKEAVKNFRAWLLETFLVPVTISKCEHDYKLIRFNVFRLGKTKYNVSHHKCKKCKLVKKYTTKY
jgi:hypothetical protein